MCRRPKRCGTLALPVTLHGISVVIVDEPVGEAMAGQRSVVQCDEGPMFHVNFRTSVMTRYSFCDGRVNQ